MPCSQPLADARREAFSVRERLLRPILPVIAVAILHAGAVRAEDAVELLLKRGAVPADRVLEHGYSDFSDPLGRFLDLLAAGALADARALQTDACAAWLASRQNSAFSGKVWVWNTRIDLDQLCARR